MYRKFNYSELRVASIIAVLRLTDVEARGSHGEAGVGHDVHLGGVDTRQRGERHHRLSDERVGGGQVVVLQGEEEEACAHPVISLAQVTVGGTS